ncbi:hypothetical protein EDEG_03180 [Edhazardia aedis USNM 41457]|uniref:Uncharacterized protein n=1 Tax=Edhazardia aedis (strain USNM 41457) TaxID=1003232 RepID=J9D4B5_EDHAE|nr:hypothetical protein EDEG_03180 [Edhazardia aedis USNM 41457]|eukprot:EJW02394.1 hypothetical protein EDEG_03180 [Edhazardia aedis USNM 41457]
MFFLFQCVRLSVLITLNQDQKETINIIENRVHSYSYFINYMEERAAILENELNEYNNEINRLEFTIQNIQDKDINKKLNNDLKERKSEVTNFEKKIAAFRIKIGKFKSELTNMEKIIRDIYAPKD